MKECIRHILVSNRFTRALCLTSIAVAFLSAPTSFGAQWDAAESEVEILVVTKDEDGDERETTIWIAVLDGEAFVRTSGTAWERNMKRDPVIVLRIAGEELAVRGERVEDDSLVDRVQARFREKYGFADRLARAVRFFAGGSRIYRVDAL